MWCNQVKLRLLFSLSALSSNRRQVNFLKEQPVEVAGLFLCPPCFVFFISFVQQQEASGSELFQMSRQWILLEVMLCPPQVFFCRYQLWLQEAKAKRSGRWCCKRWCLDWCLAHTFFYQLLLAGGKSTRGDVVGGGAWTVSWGQDNGVARGPPSSKWGSRFSMQ